MVRSKKACAALIVVLASFGTLYFSSPVAYADRQEGFERVNDFTIEGWNFKLGGSLQELRAVGKVLRERITIIDNPHHKNQKDEIRELSFDGLHIIAYFPATDHRRLFLQEVEVTKRKFKIKHGLNIGVPISKVISVLGEPNEVNADVYIYRGETNAAYFHIKNGTVAKIRWELYVD